MDFISAGPDMSWAWLIPLFSLFSFMLIITLGKLLPRGGAFLAPVAVFSGFIVFIFVFLDFLDHGSYSKSFSWLEVGITKINWGVLVDPLSLVMVGIITFVAFGIQIYSWTYMKEDNRFSWYFAVHSLFVASMLLLVLADNLLLLYFAWELVGLCSYLLIGFWYEKRSAAEAAKKAFVTTRIGDVGFLIGALLLFRETGTFEISVLFEQAKNFDQGLITASTILILLGAIGKSAQIPFHVWLPDAMEGPTPVSALIHAATMVVAGVFLVARLFPLFELSSFTMTALATIGLLTALMAASIASVMTDLKRILAYSTVSHLGFMMLALGSGGLTAGIFHLLVHAFAKAMLFLSAGSVSHGTDTLDIREMGGLRKQMPLTTLCFLIGGLSLAGIPPLSGFFSKDEILLSVAENLGLGFFLVTLLAVFISGFYTARVLFVVFFGPPGVKSSGAHESPYLMLIPMLVFSVFSVILGGLAPSFGSFLHLGHGPATHFHIDYVLAAISLFVGLMALALGWLVYIKQSVPKNAFSGRFGVIYRVFENKYYFDEVYQWIIDRIVLVLGRGVAIFDRVIVNDLGVDGTGNSFVKIGRKLRYHETGYVYNYAMGMVLGLLGLVLLGAVIL